MKRFSVCFLFAALLCSAAPASNYFYTNADKAVFAFFHFTDGIPGYDNWVRNSPLYLSARTRAEQDKILNEEILRLQWGFGTLDPRREDLHIKTDILLQAHRFGDAEYLSFKFVNSGTEEVPYFPFPYGREWISVVLNDLGNYTTVRLSAEQATHVHEYIKDEKVHPGKIEIRIRPVSADMSAPIQLGGTEQWLMLGKISGVQFFTKAPDSKETSLWKYTDPALLTETEKALMPLLQ